MYTNLKSRLTAASPYDNKYALYNVSHTLCAVGYELMYIRS